MTMISRFEDIQAWQEARRLVKKIYGLISSGKFSKDVGLRDQIQHTSVSTMTNIDEGFDCESKLELHLGPCSTLRLTWNTLMKHSARSITSRHEKPRH